MLTKRNNPKSNSGFLALSNPEDGCCGTPGTPCMFLARIADDVTELTSITYLKDGVSTVITIEAVVDGSDVNTIHAALVAALTAGEPAGGGFVYNDGDIKVFLDPFDPNDSIVIGIISDSDFVSIDMDGGDDSEFFKGCVHGTFCQYNFPYTYDEDLVVVIDGALIGTINESDAADTLTAIDSALDTAGYTTSAVLVRDSDDDPAIADVRLWLPVNVQQLFINGTEVFRTKCELKYIVSEV